MVKEDIETVIDRLLDFVNRAGKAPLGDAAAAVGRPANQVERLALLLEEKGLLEVHYDVTGVKIVAVKPEGEEEAKEEEAAQSGVLEEAAELEKEVMTSESLQKFFEKDLERRIIRAEKMLELLEKSDYTKEEIGRTAKEVELAIKQLEAFEKEIVALTQKGEAFRQKLVGFKQKLSKIKPIERAKQQAERRSLKEKIARILAEIKAFIEFLKQDLKKLVPKPGAKTPLPKITPAQAQQEKKEKQEYPPMEVQARPKIEKAHKVELIRGGKPVITTFGASKPLVTTPFTRQKGAEQQREKKERPLEAGREQVGRKTESQLARAVESLEKMAEAFTGGTAKEKPGSTRPKKPVEKPGSTRPKKPGQARPEKPRSARPKKPGQARPEKPGQARPKKPVEKPGQARPEKPGQARPKKPVEKPGQARPEKPRQARPEKGVPAPDALSEGKKKLGAKRVRRRMRAKQAGRQPVLAKQAGRRRRHASKASKLKAGWKRVKVVRVRKDGRRQRYWVLKKTK